MKGGSWSQWTTSAPTYRYDYQGNVYHWQPVEPPGIRFSPEEWRNLGLAIGVLTLAFTIARSGMFTVGYPDILYIAFSSFAAIFTAFFLHELGHKIVAQQYGCWAEFRAWNRGLFIALLFSLFGFVFAAPGAVYIQGHLTREQNGKVSAIGPGTNVMVGLAAILALYLSPDGFFAELFYFIAYINLFLAGFNLLPIPPMDGSKIWRWDKGVYVGMAVVIGFLFLFALPLAMARH